MSVVQLDFYDREDLNGTPLLSIDDEDAFLEGFEMRVSLRDLGSGLITLSRQGVSADDNPSFLFDVARAESFVRVLVPEISTDYLFGFFLDNRKTQVLSTEESAGMDIIIGGSGPLYYLSRAILWNEKFSSTAATVDETNGIWTFPDNSNWNAGKVFETLLSEDSNNTLATFLSDLTLGFDNTNDSAGNAWTETFDGGLKLAIGTHYLQALRIMQKQTPDLDAWMHLGTPGTPEMELRLYNTLGRDLTGSTMGTGVVLFKAGINSDPKSGNILTGIEAVGQSTLKPSHVLVRGADGVYSQVDRSLWSAGDFTKAVAVDYDQTAGATSLFRYGRRVMADWDLREDAQQLEIHPGFDEDNGLYMPGPSGSSGHFWIGDSITLKTGGEVVHSVLDYHYTDERVTGIRMVLDEAADGSDSTKAALSWHVVAELNEVYGLPPGQLDSGVGICCGPQLCLPATFDSPVFEEGYADATQDPGTSSIFTYGLNVDGTADTALFVLSAEDEAEGAGHVAFTSVQWRPSGTSSPSHNFTKVYGLTNGVQVWMLVDPPAATDASALVVCNSSTGHTRLVASAYVSNIDPVDPYRAIDVATGTSTATAITASSETGDLVLNLGGQLKNDVASLAVPTAGGGQTSIGTDTENANAGQRDGSMGFGRGSSAPTWTFNASRPWWAVALVVKGEATAGDLPQDIGADGSASAGTSVRAARCDHVHEHGYLESGGPYHTAAGISVTPFGTIAATDAQAALEEVFAEASGGVSDHGALTGLTDDDHTQYVLKTDGGKEVVNTVASSGTTETLDLGDGNVHDVTLTDNCTFTFTGATNGVACSMTLLARQDGTGSRTVTWPGSVVWPNATAPVLSTAANAVDVLTFLTLDGGTTWYGAYAGAGGAIVDSDDVRDAGRWEVVVSGSPAVAVEDAGDWLYTWVT